MIRANYSSTTSDASSCIRGYSSLQFLQWFYTNDQIDTPTNAVNAFRISSLSTEMYDSYIAALDGVLCDGQTLLITLPTEWTLSSSIVNAVYAITSLGVGVCCGLAAFVLLYANHPVVRSASPLFLLISLAGQALLFAAGIVLVAKSTVTSCAAFSWLVNLGLMLTFTPLFAKTWRIYRIFGRKKLAVVSISNRKLLVGVCGLIFADSFLMAIWQGVGNLHPLVVDVASSSSSSLSAVAELGSRTAVDEYVQCGVPNGSSRTMFAVICVEKGLLFLFGALMAFTTRKVSSRFNESSGIALAIYNVCFTVGIIAPIIMVTDAAGNVLTLLLAFTLLWIASFTGGILLVPKVMSVCGRGAAGTEEQQAGTKSVSDDIGLSGYTFRR